MASQLELNRTYRRVMEAQRVADKRAADRNAFEQRFGQSMPLISVYWFGREKPWSVGIYDREGNLFSAFATKELDDDAEARAWALIMAVR